MNEKNKKWYRWLDYCMINIKYQKDSKWKCKENFKKKKYIKIVDVEWMIKKSESVKVNWFAYFIYLIIKRKIK
jgi:hypothetical protein